MTVDIDDLLRDALAGRAADLTDAPRWAGPPVRDRRRRGAVLAAVAAVAAIVLVVAGGGAWLAARDDHPTRAGGAVGTTCTESLPADWRAAVIETEPLFQGAALSPWVAVGRNLLVGTIVHPDATQVVSVFDNAAPTVWMTLPADRIVTRIDADPRWIVVSSAPRVPVDNPDSPVDRITVLDTLNGSTTSITRTTDRVQDRGAVLQGGAIFWVDGTAPQVRAGTVVRYDLASRSYAVVGDAQHSGEIARDARGVGWPGGSAPAPDAPPGLPAFFTPGGQYQPVYSDGTDTAFQDGATVVWTQHSGTTRSWHVRTDSGADGSPVITGVAGPIVFYAVNDTDSGTFALDTRTGAVAHLADDVDVAYPSFVTDGTVRLVHQVDLSVTRLDPAMLSALHC